MKVVRNVLTSDTVAPGWLAARRICDELLTSIGGSKLLVLGRIWAGGMSAQVDAVLAAVEPLTRGFIPGHVVGADPVPPALDMGRRWVGDLREQIADAVRGRRGSEAPDDVDVGEVLEAVAQLQAQMGTEAPDFTAITDSVRKLRRRRDAVAAKRRMIDAARTRDEAQEDLSRANASSRSEVAKMNAASKAQWGERASGATRDSVGGVRDAVDAANKATDMRLVDSAKNQAAAEFWVAKA